jgi:hypothetical protein
VEGYEMISIVYNEIAKAVEIMFDDKGVDLLVDNLLQVKTNGGHLHLDASDGLSAKSPYGHSVVYTHLILGFLPSEAWSDNEL